MRASLEHILVLVTDDLRFAETKNAALLTANAATVIGIVQIFASHAHLGAAVVAYLFAIGLAGTVSGIFGLVSFIPGARPRPPGGPPGAPGGGPPGARGGRQPALLPRHPEVLGRRVP
jgi:hypothetical protein